MKDIIKRIEDERTELDEKLNRLNIFIGSDAFDELDEENIKLLLIQQATMVKYSNILTDRINLLNKGN